jgi:hypothetical protein
MKIEICFFARLLFNFFVKEKASCYKTKKLLRIICRSFFNDLIPGLRFSGFKLSTLLRAGFHSDNYFS